MAKLVSIDGLSAFCSNALSVTPSILPLFPGRLFSPCADYLPSVLLTILKQLLLHNHGLQFHVGSRRQLCIGLAVIPVTLSGPGQDLSRT